MIVVKHDDGVMRSLDGQFELTNVHPESVDCYNYGCVMHFESYSRMVDWPLNWRTDRGIMERICEHGVGHPDIDSANWLTRNGMGFENIHGCDGCCAERN